MDLSLYADIKPPFELKLEFEKRRRTPQQSRTPLSCSWHACPAYACVCGTRREGRLQTGYHHIGGTNIASTPSSAHLSQQKMCPISIFTKSHVLYNDSVCLPINYRMQLQMRPILRTTAMQGRVTLAKLQPCVKLTGELPSRSEGLAVVSAARVLFPQ